MRLSRLVCLLLTMSSGSALAAECDLEISFEKPPKRVVTLGFVDVERGESSMTATWKDASSKAVGKETLPMGPHVLRDALCQRGAKFAWVAHEDSKRVLLVFAKPFVSRGQAVDDAHAVLNGLSSLVEANLEPEMLTSLSIKSCSEAPSCAGRCSKQLELAAFAEGEARAKHLAGCFQDFAAARGRNVSAEQWFAKYLSKYLSDARKHLSADDQKRLEGVRAALKLP